jgi:KDO2-lipid IV(A) lauroyltransferase
LKERLAIGVLQLLAVLPLPLVHLLGSLLGGLYVLVPNKQRRNALINIRLCLPELSPKNQLALRNAAMHEFAKTYLEIAALWLRPPGRVLALVKQVSGGELLRREGNGQGILVLSPHLGAWELAGLYLSAQGPVTSMYRPQGLFEELILNARERAGARLVPTDAGGIRCILSALQSGEYVGILPDQEPKSDKAAVFAPLFGVPAYTMLLVNRLARKTGARVLFMFAQRLPRGRGFHIRCLPAPPEVVSADPVAAASALNEGIAACVRLCPEQYHWTYKRFRRRPPGMPKLYTGPL